jgi:hypothetical protein
MNEYSNGIKKKAKTLRFSLDQSSGFQVFGFGSIKKKLELNVDFFLAIEPNSLANQQFVFPELARVHSAL